jgi:hypothetical protein
MGFRSITQSRKGTVVRVCLVCARPLSSADATYLALTLLWVFVLRSALLQLPMRIDADGTGATGGTATPGRKTCERLLRPWDWGSTLPGVP